ncbi:MAG: zinc ribbon domain-containing protein [Muribaculum sp.]|nr:zinc ribbon domain-containing protein [Muribaculum sp.]MCM1142764.1 zinc ribbon domain-containing protein [Muribaculum sp.]
MTIKCKRCGYPVIDEMSSYPNCGNIVSDTDALDTITCPHCGLTEIDPSEEYCPQCGQPLYEEESYSPSDTAYEDVIPICTLSPITIAGERKMSTRTFEDEGEGVSLSRANTAPNDQSIDEELQAHLFFYEGNWYVEEGVEDRRSTYVHAGKGIKLTPGDIIRLGDREFEFNIKTK